MRIEESATRLESRHELSQQYRVETETNVSFRGVLRELRAAAPETPAPAGPEDAGARVRLMLQQLIASMMELLTGEKCRCRVDEIAALPAAPAAAATPTAASTPTPTPLPATPGAPARSMEWHTRVVEHIAEHERTEFDARGRVRTADGREIDFDLSLTMCRDFACTREYEERGRVEFHDPLVINYEGRAADLTDLRFDFDLDADGSAESLPVLATGSGYLALDTNRNGRIDDGRELFGAQSGNGFADLAQLDADGNGWLDDADPVFAALGVWFPDGELKPLKETGVGALNLASAWTPFALKDADNNARGQVWRSGVYLAEDGRAGTLQQIDLGVAEAAAEAVPAPAVGSATLA
ncbi:MAG TPA: hypothetical protein VFY24_12860 [Azospira sp.]|nr:hypothetical protein [Azospira sp.]